MITYIYINIYVRDVATIHETIVEGHQHMCAFTYIFNQIHIHIHIYIYIYIHIYIHIHIHIHIHILVEEGGRRQTEPCHN